MDDPLFVGRLERFRDLLGDRKRFTDRNGALGDAVGERRPFDQLQDQRSHTLGSFQPVDSADMRMVERGQQVRLAREPGASIGIGGIPVEGF